MRGTPGSSLRSEPPSNLRLDERLRYGEPAPARPEEEVVVMPPLDGDEGCPGDRSRNAPPHHEGDHLVLGAMQDEGSRVNARSLGQRIEAVLHQETRGQDGNVL